MAESADILSEELEGVERIPSESQVPYSEIYLFEKAGDIFSFSYRNYKVSIFVSFIANRTLPVNSVSDADSGPNLM